MRKLLLVLPLLFFISYPAISAGPEIHYYNDPYCGLYGGSCPQTFMYNRNWSKIIARYNPGGRNYCDNQSMSLWIIGHPKDGTSGFTNNDWQDLNIAKQKTGGYYRWGCCYSSDPYNKICLN